MGTYRTVTAVPQGSVAVSAHLKGGAMASVGGPVAPGVYITDAVVVQAGRTWTGVDVLLLDSDSGWSWWEVKDCRSTFYGWQDINATLDSLQDPQSTDQRACAAAGGCCSD